MIKMRTTLLAVLALGTAIASSAQAGAIFGSWEFGDQIMLDDAPPSYDVRAEIRADHKPLITLQIICQGTKYYTRIVGTPELTIEKNDRMLISVDGGTAMPFATTERMDGMIETGISAAQVDIVASSRSSIRLTLPASRRDFVFPMRSTERAIAVLRQACEVSQ